MVGGTNSESWMLPSSTLEVISSVNEHDDVVSWINDMLDGDGHSADQPVDLTSLDKTVTKLVATLEIASQDTSAQLERIIEDVSRGVPRLTYNLHFMNDGALSLQSALTKVHQKSSNAVPKETSGALDRLQYLDTVKANMEAAREVLREAESWSTLESEVTSLLSEKVYSKAAERLSEANRSMVVFQNTPEYEPRRTLMVSLQNQLEASLSSALVSAITSQDVEVCKEYFAIFSNIQRESEFRNYYNGSRRSPVVEIWSTLHADETPLAELLPKYYASFLTLLNQERVSIPSIFPDPSTTLSTLITSVLSGLQPTVSHRLESIPHPALPELIVALKATEEFAASVYKVMDKIRLSSSTAPPPFPERANSEEMVLTSPPKHTSRRRSSRMSMSWRAGASTKALTGPDDMEWDRELFQPFLDFQLDYSLLERRVLEEVLEEIVAAPVYTDRARLLRERSLDVFSAAEESIIRCMAFTHGYGAVGLVNAVDVFVKAFIETWSAGSSSSALSQASIAAGEDLSDLDYTPQDWSNFQTSLHLLASARAVVERMAAFESKLRSSLVQIATGFRLARGDLMNSSIDSLRGAPQLLSQSVLNSVELHDLLEKAEPQESRELFVPPPSAGGHRHAHSPPLSMAVPATPLLAEARFAVSGFARASQVALQTTILSPLRKHLAPYSSLSSWSTQGTDGGRRVGAANDLHIPSFSLSPSEIIQRVAEGLLNLPRLFEVYADDDALSFSLETLPYLDRELLRSLGVDSAPSHPSDTIPETPSGHMRRASVNLKALSISQSSGITPEVVSSAWLSSLGRSLLAHLFADVLPNIRSLTNPGAAQLAADLDYLGNIVRALNSESGELEQELSSWKEYAEIKDEEGRKRAKEATGDSVFKHVARMRNWT